MVPTEQSIRGDRVDWRGMLRHVPKLGRDEEKTGGSVIRPYLRRYTRGDA